MKKPPPTIAELRAADRARVQRQALRQLRRTQAEAAKSGIDLSEWEGEFLGSVADRVKTYGRAFADPEKGGRGAAFSVLQTRKLKEIAAKARGEPRVFPARKGFKGKGKAED